MTSKVLVLLLLVCTASCQQPDEDDGSYNPEKYEKPYENLVDVNPPSVESPTPPPGNQFSTGFQQPQLPQPFQQQQPFQPSPPPPPPPPPPQPQQPQQQNPFFQQPQSTPPLQQPQTPRAPVPNPFPQNPFFQQPQSTPPLQQPQTPRTPVTNPFPQNPFFQRLRNSEPQPQAPAFQQQNPPFQQQIATFQPQTPPPPRVPTFRRPNPAFQPQQEPDFSPPVRDPAPVTQFIIDGMQPVKSTNYQTDDGTQRSETIDSEGNVQGQYSYVDPNGKTITVRYSAGKDGFKVEGDHIPKSLQSQAQDDVPQLPSPPPTPPQPQPQPQPQFPPLQPQPRPVSRQFDPARTRFDTPRSRFNNPAPQQFFNPPSPPRAPSPAREPTPLSEEEPPRFRSQFVNGIFQPSFQRKNTVPSQSQFSLENEVPFDFPNQNSEYEFKSRFQ